MWHRWKCSPKTVAWIATPVGTIHNRLLRRKSWRECGARMFDYDVKFVYEYSYIGITVIARDDEEAVTSAWDILADQEISAPEPQEIIVEKMGEFLV